MASKTSDFGLNYFGPGVPGSITDDGGKYTLGDRLLMSRLFAAMAVHDHQGGDRLADPSGTAALGLDTASGLLPGGLNVYYRVSYIDQYGLETAASAEAVVEMPALLQAPAFPILTATDFPAMDTNPGLGAGEYSYALTAVSGPQQTPFGIAAVLSLDGTLPCVEVDFPDAGQDGQDQWNIWRKGPGESDYTLVGTSPVADDSFIDDGATLADPDASDPSHQPPSTNLTSSTNAVTIEVPDPAIVGATPHGIVFRWRIYRSFTSGNYGTNSLLAEVVQTVNEDGTGGLITEFTDDGSIPLQVGQPLDITQTLVPSVRLNGSGAGSGPVALRSTDSLSSWCISCDLDGRLTTDVSEVTVGDGDLVLTTIGNQLYKVTVNSDGSLQTTAVPSSDVADTVFPAGDGPNVATPDGSFAYHLTVDSTGTLVTTPVGVHHPIPGLAIVGTGVPSPTMPGVWDGLLYKDRSDSFQEYTWDVDRWHKEGVATTAPTAPKISASISEFGDDLRANAHGSEGVRLTPSTSDGGYPVDYRVVATPLSLSNPSLPTDRWVGPYFGNAHELAAPGLWRLTRAIGSEVGGVFTPHTVDLTNDLTIEFDTNIYNFTGTPADGFALVFVDPAIQSDPTAFTLGGNGGSLGVKGMHGTVWAGWEAFPTDNSYAIGHTDNAGVDTTLVSGTFGTATIRGLAVHWKAILTFVSSGHYSLTIKDHTNATVMGPQAVLIPDHAFIGFTAACGGFSDVHEVTNITMVDSSSADLLEVVPTPVVVQAVVAQVDRGDGDFEATLAGLVEVGYSLEGIAHSLIGSTDADSESVTVDTRYIPNLWPDAPDSPVAANVGGDLHITINTPSSDAYAHMPNRYIAFYTTNTGAHDILDGSDGGQPSDWTEIFATPAPTRVDATAGTTTLVFTGAAVGSGTKKFALMAMNNLQGTAGSRTTHTTWTQTL